MKLVRTVLLLLAAGLFAGCLTISSSMPGSRDTTGDVWFVQDTVPPGPSLPGMGVVLESKIFYCPAVEAEGAPRIDTCYEATVPERFRK